MRVTSIAIALSLCCTALPFAVSAAGNLNVVCSADVVVCEQMTRIFSETNPDINVSMVRLSAGKLMPVCAVNLVIHGLISGGQVRAIHICRPLKRG